MRAKFLDKLLVFALVCQHAANEPRNACQVLGGSCCWVYNVLRTGSRSKSGKRGGGGRAQRLPRNAVVVVVAVAVVVVAELCDSCFGFFLCCNVKLLLLFFLFFFFCFFVAATNQVLTPRSKGKLIARNTK